MNVGAPGQAQHILQLLGSRSGAGSTGAATQGGQVPSPKAAEEQGESRAAQAAEGETGGRINTYA